MEIAPLVLTKLRIPPPRLSLVERPDLIAWLNATDQYALTLVSAHAGCGKTTLLSVWAQQAANDVAWLALDAGDNDPVRFWSYVIAAFGTVRSNIGATALTLLQSPLTPVETVLAVLLNSLVEHSENNDRSIVFILDDYQYIDMPAIHSGMTYLIEHLPPNVRLLIASRSDPPLPLARLRARRQLSELRAADLRFRTDEAATLFAPQTALRPEDINILVDRTEGWIAGLQIAALSLGNHTDPVAFVRSFGGSQRHVLDYLVSEVLEQQTIEIQGFLLRTSLLDMLSGPLCDVVTDASTSQHVLEELERDNVLLVALDGERSWYRYHHLFAGLLRHQLQRSYPDEIRHLHERASGWYEQHGMTESAIQHALLSQNYHQAAALIGRVGIRTVMRGEVATAARWLEAIPPEIVTSSAYLAVVQAAVAYLTSSQEETEQWCKTAERNIGHDSALDETIRRQLQGETLVLRALVAGTRSQIATTIALSEKALALLRDTDADDSLLNAIGATLGWAYSIKPAPIEAKRILTASFHQASASGHIIAAMSAAFALATVLIEQGSLHDAESLLAEARTIALKRSAQALLDSVTITFGIIAYHRNELDAAATMVQQGLDLALRQNSGDAISDGYVYRALVEQAQGDSARALQIIQQGADAAQRLQRPSAARIIAAYEALIQLRRGDHAAAAAWLTKLDQREPSERSDVRDAEYIVAARIEIAQQPTAASAALVRLGTLQREAEQHQRNGKLIEIRIVQAAAYDQLRQHSAALDALQHALELAAPAGFVRLFLDEGAPIAHLLAQLIAQRPGDHPSHQYAAHLLMLFPPPARETTLAPSTGLIPKGNASLPEPLSERELEILRLVAQDASNKIIADTLFLSVGTVKNHMTNILGKLAVTNRYQAIRRAHDLGLL